MHPRSMIALGVGGVVALVAAAFGIARQMGVKSYGHPVGRVVRAGDQLSVLMETCDPYFPSLKGRSESDMSYSYSLWLMPAAGNGELKTIRLDRGVRSSERSQFSGVLGEAGGVVWLRIRDVIGVDGATGRRVTSQPPTVLANMPISKFLGSTHNPTLEPYRTLCVRRENGEWLALADEVEAPKDLKQGTRLYHNSTCAGSFRDRGLYAVTAEAGPVPRIAGATRVAGVDLHNAAFMRASENGDVVRFSGPEGFLVVYQSEGPGVRTFKFARVNVDGTIAWSVDSQMGRLNQVLPHESVPAFVGELRDELTEPIVAVVQLNTGTIETRSLKGPLN